MANSFGKWQNLRFIMVSMTWRCCNHTIDLAEQGLIMGILNVTPDSFSDGGRFEKIVNAIGHARQMISEGAAIIDVGGESTRPGAEAVTEEEEARRVLPVIEKLGQLESSPVISIDTSKAEIARQACEAGATIINDVTAFRGDPDMARVAAETNAGVVLMHMQGQPRTMQKQPTYGDVVAEVRDFFAERLEFAEKSGIDRDRIVFDPGIGFGKTLEHNLELLRHLDQLTVADRPLLLGVSRKSFFGKLLNADLEDRFAPTVATTALASAVGVRLHRVHDVRANLDAMRMAEALEQS
ncbi:MAG: dihydropteroate synthase [Verrucomicrobiota bacterium]